MVSSFFNKIKSFFGFNTDEDNLSETQMVVKLASAISENHTKMTSTLPSVVKPKVKVKPKATVSKSEQVAKVVTLPKTKSSLKKPVTKSKTSTKVSKTKK